MIGSGGVQNDPIIAITGCPRAEPPRPQDQPIKGCDIPCRVSIFHLQFRANRAHIHHARAGMHPVQPRLAVGGMDHRAMVTFARQNNRNIIRRRVALPLHHPRPPLDRELGQRDRDDPTPAHTLPPIARACCAEIGKDRVPSADRRETAHRVGAWQTGGWRYASGREPHSDPGKLRAGSASRIHLPLLPAWQAVWSP